MILVARSTKDASVHTDRSINLNYTYTGKILLSVPFLVILVVTKKEYWLAGSYKQSDFEQEAWWVEGRNPAAYWNHQTWCYYLRKLNSINRPQSAIMLALASNWTETSMKSPRNYNEPTRESAHPFHELGIESPQLTWSGYGLWIWQCESGTLRYPIAQGLQVFLTSHLDWTISQPHMDTMLRCFYLL